ncbi:dTMP kinase [Roseicyclus sp. F158]|uniref:Thymidylate kinase n=1 Tax=Tropicimonas omnivorans TaxID=3075590 RepID=A0ABU3DKZ9_9RHOB|nr:dTMP kinase [Roseicyclus sp. F158]MDT0684268.1 dTMP kinase [Roseicyclus sp. F158]
METGPGAAGVFITFEGIDGSGKSTQARRLHDSLTSQGRDAILTREPGGSPGAERIRRLLVEGAAEDWSPISELLLFNAARRDHLERLIRPSLSRGAVVVSDRFADSTRVYQGAARADLRALADRLHADVIGLEPDLTFIIDADPGTALSRGLARNNAEDRFEGLGLAFQERLREGFLELAAGAPERCMVVDGNRPEDEIAADIAAHVARHLG